MFYKSIIKHIVLAFAILTIPARLSFSCHHPLISGGFRRRMVAVVALLADLGFFLLWRVIYAQQPLRRLGSLCIHLLLLPHGCFLPFVTVMGGAWWQSLLISLAFCFMAAWFNTSLHTPGNAWSSYKLSLYIYDLIILSSIQCRSCSTND